LSHMALNAHRDVAMMAGSMWDLLRIEYVRTVFAHLGYPGATLI